MSSSAVLEKEMPQEGAPFAQPAHVMRSVVYQPLQGGSEQDQRRDLAFLMDLGVRAVYLARPVQAFAQMCFEAGLAVLEGPAAACLPPVGEEEQARFYQCLLEEGKAPTPCLFDTVPDSCEGGLIGADRVTCKDAFYLYKAFWAKEPFVHLCGHSQPVRAGSAATIVVYSNLPSVTLLVNGRVWEKKTSQKVFAFENIPLKPSGFTVIAAQNGVCRDSMRLQKQQEL